MQRWEDRIQAALCTRSLALPHLQHLWCMPSTVYSLDFLSESVSRALWARSPCDLPPSRSSNKSHRLPLCSQVCLRAFEEEWRRGSTVVLDGGSYCHDLASPVSERRLRLRSSQVCGKCVGMNSPDRCLFRLRSVRDQYLPKLHSEGLSLRASNADIAWLTRRAYSCSGGDLAAEVDHRRGFTRSMNTSSGVT